MNKQEVNRLEIIQQTTAGQLTQQQASERLHLSVRQIKRLVKRYRGQGAQGLISRHRGKPANNAIAAAVKNPGIGINTNHLCRFFTDLRTRKTDRATWPVIFCGDPQKVDD